MCDTEAKEGQRWRIREAVNAEGQDRVMDRKKKTTNKEAGFKCVCTYEEAGRKPKEK